MHYEVYRLTSLGNDKIQLCKLTGRDSTCICISENSIEQCDYTKSDTTILVGRDSNSTDIPYAPNYEKCRPII